MSDIGQRRDDVRAGRQQLRLPPVVHLSGDIVRHHQFGGPVEVKLSQHQLGFVLVDAGNLGAQQGDLVVDGLHGVLQRPAPAMASASMPRTLDLATCRSAVAVSTAACLMATAI